jgi:hypothetical protein
MQKELSLWRGVEILVHGYYAVARTEAAFDPDNRFGWPTLLWTAGCGGLDGQECLGESLVSQNYFMSEWECNILRSQVWI